MKVEVQRLVELPSPTVLAATTFKTQIPPEDWSLLKIENKLVNARSHLAKLEQEYANAFLRVEYLEELQANDK